MNYVRLGNSGLKITELVFGSALTIGTEIMDEKASEELIDKAWELGIRTYDVSNNYGYGGAERLVGKCLEKYPREEYVLITKGSWPIGETPYHRGLSRKHILWAFEESLKKLNKDYVDIYFAHRYDPEVPMEEIARTFNWLINTGKVRYWATSEWPLTALQECMAVCDKLNLEKPITEQFIYSFAVQKSVTNGVKAFCDENGMGTMGFSPLCQGYLTGKYRNGVPSDSRIAKSEQINYDKTKNFYAQNKERIDSFLAICDEMQVDYVAAALQWCIRQQIYPVFGSSKVSQLEANVKAIEQILPEELWTKLNEIK
jgi:aryl-alcohol dehydrogenase-like predicted oxidoreductase